MTYNLADAFDVIAATCPEREALVQGGQHLTWQTLERRARNVSAWMLAQGASRQGKVAIYTYNHPAYMEGVYAAMKASLVPANVNYRYREEELRYLLDNADAEIAIVHEEFVPLMAKVAPRVPKLRGVLVVSEQGAHPSTAGLPNAASYEAVASTDAAAPRVTRSADDHLFLYTGGTTGMPKAVMWRQSDLYLRLAGGGLIPPPKTLDDLRAQVLNPPLPTRTLIGPPLMHGTGWFSAVIAWLTGGAVILLDNPKRFDASELFGIVEREKPAVITIVGDSFAKPMLRELEHPKRPYDLSSLAMIVSSGVMWSQETKEGLLKYVPQLTLIDSLGSSEAIGMGLSITTAAGSVQTGKFQLSDTTRLLDETLQVIDAKPGSKGLVGVGGPHSVGYYKDPEKSARTFVDTPRPILGTRRLGAGERGRADPAAVGARIGVHQHRRREGLPRRSRRGREARRGRARLRGGRCPRRALRRSDHRRRIGRQAARRRCAEDLRQAAPGELQGAEARRLRRRSVPQPVRQGRLQAHQGSRHAGARHRELTRCGCGSTLRSSAPVRGERRSPRSPATTVRRCSGAPPGRRRRD
jgi:fatty-acyl-CoA synthase